MSDHSHYGEYADERHDHDLDYAGKHHRHFDLERDVKALHAELDAAYAAVRELRDDLNDALERIRQLEDRQPGYAPGPEDEDGAPGLDQTECGPCIREDECACLTEPDLEPYCGTCGEEIGIFYGHGASWHHWRNDDAGRTRIYDAGHAATVTWREAGVT